MNLRDRQVPLFAKILLLIFISAAITATLIWCL
jgi:hypothetical protein